MKTQIIGSTLPVLEVSLDAGDKLVAEAGQFSWMTQTVQMNTTTQAGGAKGLMGVFKRAVGGGGLFMTEYVANGPINDPAPPMPKLYPKFLSDAKVRDIAAHVESLQR